MDNADLIEALEELFETQADISAELEYDYVDPGLDGEDVVQVRGGWGSVIKLISLLEDISPELSYLQGLLEANDDF